ncbi:type II secretion system protein [Natranaerobius thermophilus]|uniref:Prepilin-type N-terminal cleavage/methylation domain-containing protein n=1 Tax=Natranaerobius thermophilus (strain ATCC BAA-1301 / DSM 18059 / JW/NM-WN-LF) TaxID=457570 RepID=B2A7F3_NATTJ|nr:prepilin-type N-terminal cleavage/methylation domain-containing protein [Natranaerobius thermophilus]ACB85662.1 hypothetical protein Nther_2095 [Natranaerobius thermophilus JW/NM-WN-LF]
MGNWMKRNLKQTRGFTLIELLAVIAILGLLVAIAVPNLFGVIDRAEAESKKADARAVKNAALTYLTLERVERDEAVGLEPLNDMVSSEGTLADYIDMTEDRANELGVDKGSNWGEFLDNLEEIIQEDSEENDDDKENGG